MPDLRSRFLVAAVRPFHDNAEQRLAATHMLDALCPPADEDAERAIHRWDAIDARPRSPLAWIVFFTALAVISAVVLASFVREKPVLLLLAKSKSEMITLSSDPAESIGENLTSDQKLLMLCDPSRGSKAERIEALWDSQPENPAYFAGYLGGSSEPPKDFLDVARRLDPDNSWFTYLAAEARVRRTYQDNAGKWEFSHPERFAEAMEIFHQASGQPKFENYQTTLLRQRIPLLPRSDLRDGVRSIAAMNGIPQRGNLPTTLLSFPLVARAWQLGETEDITGFHALTNDVDTFLSRLMNAEAPTLMEAVIVRNSVEILMENLGKSAKKLGLNEEADHRLGLANRVKQLKKDTKRSGTYSASIPLGERSGTIIREYLESPGYALNPPILTEADVRPGRLAEHELVSQVGSVAVWMLLVCALVSTALFRFRVSQLIRRLGVRAASLLRPGDTAWILGLGVILPIGFTLAIQRLTPLGGRDFGLQIIDLRIRWGTVIPIPLAQFVGLAVLIIISSLLVTRWRLGVRSSSLGFPTMTSWTGCIAVISAAGFIPIIGWEIPVVVKLAIYPALGVLALAVLWLVAVAARALTGNPETLFHRSSTARVLEPAYGFAMLLLICAVPIFKSAERHWFQQDRLMNYDPAKPALFPYEYDLAQQVMRELRETVEMPSQLSAE